MFALALKSVSLELLESRGTEHDAWTGDQGAVLLAARDVPGPSGQLLLLSAPRCKLTAFDRIKVSFAWTRSFGCRMATSAFAGGPQAAAHNVELSDSFNRQAPSGTLSGSDSAAALASQHWNVHLLFQHSLLPVTRSVTAQSGADAALHRLQVEGNRFGHQVEI